MMDIADNIVAAVLVIGALVGVAFYLDRRRAKKGPIGPVETLGPYGKLTLLAIRIVEIGMLVAIVGAGVFRVSWLSWVLLGCVALYIVLAQIHSFLRVIGK